jgi:lactoylglutathione lyase
MSNENESLPVAWPGPIRAITLFTEDLHATRTFYEDVFGLALFFDDEHSAVFKLGDTLINLLDIQAAPELIDPAAVAAPDAGHRAVFTLGVDDVDAMSAELVARGVTLLNGPMNRPWGIRTASFMDPTGTIWEIAQ